MAARYGLFRVGADGLLYPDPGDAVLKAAEAFNDAAVKDPPRDCPPCLRCDLPLATPIKEAGVERWDGVPEATLFCPSCGYGWVGTKLECSRALASWQAYEEELASRPTPGGR